MKQRILKGLFFLDHILVNDNIFLVKDSAFDLLPIKSYFDKFQSTDFTDFTPNPLYEQVINGVEKFKKSGAKTIIAVGGGSTIDVAKCIKLYSDVPDVLLIAVPTTAGTGSESTPHAVIYKNGVKQSISDKSIIPDIAILESEVLHKLPVYQKKCTMLDALCQSIESWWNVNSTEESIEYSRRSIELIRDNYKNYIFNNNSNAAEAIMEAANLSGQAIAITATTAPHAMSYKITSLYGFPHGHAVAVSMSKVWRYMVKHTEKCVDKRGEGYLKSVFDALPVDVDWFDDLMAQLRMEYPVSQTRANDIDVLVNSVNPTRLKNNPVELDSDTLKELYEEIIK